MKFSALISVLFLCFVFVACASEEDASCVTGFDCADGYLCINSVCQPPVAVNDEDSQDDVENQDSSEPSDEKSDDNVSPEEDSDITEIPDDIVSCPNACSGFGECNLETGKCTCTGNHGGEDCSGCAEGYHLEAEGDDEDGNPDIRSCVVNLTCEPNPCNNNGCKEVGATVQCTCAAANHQGGRWCERCADGYMLNNSGVCKEDCSLKTCTPPQKCGIDYAINEANCNNCENEYYTGTDCKSCDIEHFCNGHATACVVEGGTEKCTCEAAYAGSTCNTCANGYFQSNGVCIKSCDANKCFKTRQCEAESVLGGTTTGIAVAYGTCNPTTGTCDCDPGWVTGNSEYGVGNSVDCTNLLRRVLETFNNVECAQCDQNNPPAEYAQTGCPTECPMTMGTIMFCDVFVGMPMGIGKCYYEPGTLRLYCKCESGCTMSGSKYYDENPIGACASESSE